MPPERLEAKHREFQKRMMAAPSIPSSSTADPAAENVSPAAAAAAAQRRVLGEPSAASSSRSRGSRSGSTRTPSVSEDVFSAPAPSRPNGRMPIFVDPTGDAENDPNQATNPTPWPELGTRKARIKENTMEVSKAAGTTLRQAGRSTRAASGSRIAVFRDPGPEDAEMPPPSVPAAKKDKARTASKSSIAIFRDEDGEVGPSEPAPKKGKARTASKSSIGVFRDDDENPEPPETKKGKTRASSKGTIAVFRDDDETPAPEPTGPKKGKARTASKSSIAVFRDEDEPTAGPAVPSTPKFVPFRDEEVCLLIIIYGYANWS